MGDAGYRKQRLRITCKRGHTQEITIDGMSRDDAEQYAGILDGSSPFFVHPSPPESLVGKCGICAEAGEAVPFEADVLP